MRLGCALTALAWVSAAFAQQTCAATEVEAVEARAQRANRDGHHEEALGLFQQVYARCQGPRALARAALTEAAMGRWLDAERDLHAALEASGDPWVRRNAGALELEARRIDEHLGSLLLTGQGGPARVEVDGRDVGGWPMERPLRVLQGTVAVVVRAAGFRPVERTLRVSPGALVREEITLVPLEPEHAAPPTAMAPTPTSEPPRATSVPMTVEPATPARALAPPASPSRASTTSPALRVVGWSALGLGVAGLALGGVAVAMRESALSDIEGRCHGATPDVSYCDGRADVADGARPFVYAGFAAGAVLSIAGIVTLIAAPGAAPRREAARWSCAMGPGAVGVACGWQL